MKEVNENAGKETMMCKEVRVSTYERVLGEIKSVAYRGSILVLIRPLQARHC
jgi:hypothetical protein